MSTDLEMETENIDYNQESILVVDDDPYLREVLVELLNTMGFHITTTSNGADALGILKEMPFTFY